MNTPENKSGACSAQLHSHFEPPRHRGRFLVALSAAAILAIGCSAGEDEGQEESGPIAPPAAVAGDAKVAPSGAAVVEDAKLSPAGAVTQVAVPTVSQSGKFAENVRGTAAVVEGVVTDISTTYDDFN